MRTRKAVFIDAKRGYWSLTGYNAPEPRGTEYRQLYLALQQACVQQVHVLERIIGEARQTSFQMNGLRCLTPTGYSLATYTLQNQTTDYVIHGYFRLVDLDIVWAIVTEDLPPVISKSSERSTLATPRPLLLPASPPSAKTSPYDSRQPPPPLPASPALPRARPRRPLPARGR